MSADSLGHAIELQNATPTGSRPGCSHSIRTSWPLVRSVEAGNLYVNRGITGAIVRRQPFGGWKRSSVGAGTKAGGPNYLVGLTDWVRRPGRHGRRPGPAAASLLAAARAAGLRPRRDLARAAIDALAWESEFGTARDVSGLRPSGTCCDTGRSR